MVLAVLQVLHGLVELLDIQLEPVQAVAETEVEFAALVPVVHQQRLLGRALGDQQRTLMAGGLQVLLELVVPGGLVVDEHPALVQVVPVGLAVAALGDLCRLAGIAELARLLHPAAGVAVGAGFVVQGPDQFRQFAAATGRQLAQRLLGKGIGAHCRNGGQAVVQQRYGVEDALDDPQFLGFQQVDAGGTPPDAARAASLLEPCFLLAKAPRSIDQPFPVPTFCQGETHCGAAFIDIGVPVVFLGVPALDQRQIEAAGVAQVGLCRGRWLLVGNRRALAPVVEQLGVELLDVPALAAFALPAAADEPGGVRQAEQLLLATGRAFTLAQVLRSCDGLQAELQLQLGEYLGAKLDVHVLHAMPLSCRRSALMVRTRPTMCGWSSTMRLARKPVGV
ncbi:hypothetical protein D9M71_225650 [compost metagenome]